MGAGDDAGRQRRRFSGGGTPAQITAEIRRQWKMDVASRRQRALEEYKRLTDQLSDSVDSLVGFGVTLEQLAELSDIDLQTLKRLVTRPAP